MRRSPTAGRAVRRNYTQHQWDQLGAHGGYLDYANSALDAEAGRLSACPGHCAFAFLPTQVGNTVGVSWTEGAQRAPQGEPPPPPREARPIPPYWGEQQAGM